MNKSEKIICLLLGAVLAWYIWGEFGRAKERAKYAAEHPAAVAAATNAAAQAEAARTESAAGEESRVPAAVEPAQAKPSVPERVVVLENEELKLELSTWGAVVKKATLKKYAKDCGEISDENPPVVFDFADSPLGAGAVVEAFEVTEEGADSVRFVNGEKSRTIRLGAGYRITLDDDGIGGAVSLGQMRMGDSKNDLLSVDSWAMDAGKGKPGVIHHCEGDSLLKGYLVGGLSGGCSGSKSAAGMPAETLVKYPGAQQWVAVKNRFFVTAFCSSTAANAGFDAKVARDIGSASYRPASVSASVMLTDDAAKRTSVFYVGPKKQSLLWDLGMKDVMEFGMWRWICYPLVWVLNLFYGWIPNFGVAIILLTILVRLLFWPLTHKSTVGMKKMQELQPKMKEIQAKYKDNPQRMQQETWALYRAEKVNPASSCLPMLIQIPVFIALFNVLRSAVELRYAPFLWIADLSEPEGLFASWFPFGGLNLLPILMAVSTGLQSAFTPSTGDKNQQRMMMVFMPLMMLVMFYSFPSALSLYWFLSNLFSIVQMWIIRRQTAKERAAAAPAVEVIDPPATRQMRRHGAVLLALALASLALGTSARTFELKAWRGETVAARLPDFCEAGAAPAPLKMRLGAMRPVKFASEPGSLRLEERYDRVEWGGAGAGPRVVEVSVPADAKPGVYRCGMMEVKVLDRVLPPPKEWKYYLDLWQHPWAVARIAGVRPFSKEHYAAMRPVWELLATAGQKTLTVTLLDEPWDHQCRDAYHSMVDGGFELFDEYVEFGRSCGLGPDISCYTLCPWKLMEKPGTPEFEARWAPFIKSFAAHLKEKGWYDDVIIAMDEREPDQVKAVVDFVHRHAPGLRIAMAGNRRPSDFKGIDIDVYSQILSHVTPEFLSECDGRREKGFKTTYYVCCWPVKPNTFMESAGEEPFWLGAYPAFAGMDGFLRWAWNSWPEDPLADAGYGDWRAGDTFLAYPGGEPSWRFLELRNGIAAAEKARILRASDAPGFAKAAAAFDLKTALDGKAEWWKVRRAVLDFVNAD